MQDSKLCVETNKPFRVVHSAGPRNRLYFLSARPFLLLQCPFAGVYSLMYYDVEVSLRMRKVGPPGYFVCLHMAKETN